MKISGIILLIVLGAGMGTAAPVAADADGARLAHEARKQQVRQQQMARRQELAAKRLRLRARLEEEREARRRLFEQDREAWWRAHEARRNAIRQRIEENRARFTDPRQEDGDAPQAEPEGTGLAAKTDQGG